MNNGHKRWYRLMGGLAGIALLSLATAPIFAEDRDQQSTATTPKPREAGWIKRHEGFVKQASRGEVDVLFLGDSITDGWRGQEMWAKHFEPLKAANFGIGGDRTEHVLWRIQNGELEGINPKVAVLMIGTNNMGSNTAKEIAAGVVAIVRNLIHKRPHMKVLLLGIFPRSPSPDDPLRQKIKDVNAIISKLDDGKHIRYRDIGEKFQESDGSLSQKIMPDFLHLSPAGYKIWAEAIQPDLDELLKKDS